MSQPKPLIELASIHYGKSPADVVDTDGEFPIYGTGGRYAQSKRATVNAGIVVPRKGTLGAPHFADHPHWPSDTTFSVQARADVDLEWLFYALSNFDLTKLNEATGVPSISRSWLEKIEIETPADNSTRRHVAGILRTSDTAINKTEALIHKYQRIKAGLMHDLFTRGIGPDGQLRPPREQAPELYQETPIGWIPTEWSAPAIGDIVTSAQYGISESLEDAAVGIPVLRMNNIQSGEFDLRDLKYSASAEARRLTLRPNDVLFNRTNSMVHVGKTAIWRGEIEECSFASYLVRLHLDHDKVSPDYFTYWMAQERAQNLIRRYATPGVQQVNINPTNLQRVLIALPESLDEQSAINARLASIDAQISSAYDKVKKLGLVRSGLMERLLKAPYEAVVGDV